MACSAGAPAQRQAPNGYHFPASSGRVVDAAAVLSPDQEALLDHSLTEVEHATRHQFVVVTVKSLEGHSVEDYSLNLFNHWGVGRKGANDGVGLLVAPNERKVRIEVGQGLKKALSNEEAATIMRTRILPRFRQGQMSAGILSGSAAIIREISA